MLKRGIHLKDNDAKPNCMHKLEKRGVENLALLEFASEGEEVIQVEVIEGVTPSQI